MLNNQNKVIKVRRHVISIHETDCLIDPVVTTPADLIAFVNQQNDTLEWDEIETITHFKIVETYV